MKKNLIVLFAVFLALHVGTNLVKANEEYRLSPHDILTISVWGVEELQVKELVVRDDGKIAFPLAGELQVTGLSSGELTQVIAQSLNGYINNPQVTVNILKYHTTRIYVVGEVNKPGLYELEKQHNLIDAITAAAGYTKDAAKKKVFIISQGATTTPRKVNLFNLLTKGDMTQNVSLQDGDVVYLTENHRIDFGRDILPFIGAWYDIKRVDD